MVTSPRQLVALVGLLVGAAAVNGPAADAGGFQSAMQAFTPPAPVIVDFYAARQLGNVWTFKGEVSDSGLTDVEIYFSNLPSINGQSVLVNPDGTFEFTVQLAPGESGI